MTNFMLLRARHVAARGDVVGLIWPSKDSCKDRFLAGVDHPAGATGPDCASSGPPRWARNYATLHSWRAVLSMARLHL